ncbi:transcription elongation factor TFIIS/CRSP70 [Tanacetum coccineum]
MSCEEKELVKEVMRIKVVLDEKVGDDECGSSFAYKSLRTLQQMVLSVKVLKETMIGESVGVFLKHASKEVSRVSRVLINEWRRVVDEWVESNEKKTSLDQEEVKKNVTITVPQRPRVVRIKRKTKNDWDKDNVVPKGPMTTPEKKVENNNGIDEVLRIKGVIEKSIGDESESQSTLLDSLKKLQHMDISMETLDKTGIGKTVSILKKHVSKDVSQIAKTLVKAWKDMFEEWIKKDISNVKPISEEAKNYKGLVIHDQHSQPIGSDATSDQKSLVIHGQHSRPIDSDAATSDHKGLSNTTEEKMESTKKRVRESYKELENMKQKRKIQVIEHYELPKNSGLPPKPPVKPQRTSQKMN